MSMTIRFVVTGLFALAIGQAAWADAGAGHDHGDGGGGGTAAFTDTPRVEARLGDKLLVLLYANRKVFQDAPSRFFGGGGPAKPADPRIAVFLEGFADAVPTSGAELEAVINFLPEALREAAPGVYLSGPVVLAAGRNEIEINYTIGKESGTLPLVLLLPGGVTSDIGGTAVETPAGAIPSWLFALVALILYAAVFGLFLRRRRQDTVS
jgi:hypothetical protein